VCGCECYWLCDVFVSVCECECVRLVCGVCGVWVVCVCGVCVRQN